MSSHLSKTRAQSRAFLTRRSFIDAGKDAERDLARRAQRGDQSAYEELVRIHRPRLLTVIGRLLRRSGDVEDLAQQALLKAFLSLKRFDLQAAFGTWLYVIAINECRDHFRKKRVRPLFYEAELSDGEIRQLECASGDRYNLFRQTRDVANLTAQRELLDHLLARLDETDRIMLAMKEVAGFTVGEIGQVLDLNANTVKVRLFRARGQLVKVYRRTFESGKMGPAPKTTQGLLMRARLARLSWHPCR